MYTEQQAQIAAIIVTRLGVESNRVVPDADFAEDLGADSLDMVELTMDFEESFSIEISDAEAAGVDTVQDAFDVIWQIVAHEDDALIRPVRK